MITSLQRLGTVWMFIGSMLFIVTLLESSTIPQIYFLEIVISVSTLIVGSILSYGWREFDDRFLKALGINAYLIGTGYELKSAFIYDALATTCYSCVLGSFFMMAGLIPIFLKRGKPSKSSVYGQFIIGGLIFAIGGAIMVIDIFLKTWTYFRISPESIEKAWIDIIIGMTYFLNGLILHYIAGIKTEGREEPDVVFFGKNNIFDQIFY